jgi:hypothetical protein
VHEATRRRVATACLALAFLLPGCASQGIRYAKGDGSVTPDGLHRVQHSLGTGADVFVRPGTHMGSYTRLMLEVPKLRYDPKSLPENARDETAILERDFHQEFEKELRKSSRYSFVTEPGPDVLLVEPQLANLSLLAPTRARAARETTVVQFQGTATLVLEVADSQSRQVLLRAFETDEIQNPSGSPQELSMTSAVADSRFLFQHWARMLRGWLDQAQDIPPLPAPAAD